jgi:hypothetical protein
VISPTNIRQGEVAIFQATVSPHNPSAKLTYLWSHSNGKLISGQEGTKLRIKAVGQPGDVITATVKIMGFDPACNREASARSPIKSAAHIRSTHRNFFHAHECWMVSGFRCAKDG